MITLFCGHNSEPLTDAMVDRLGRGAPADRLPLAHGHWRGSLEATFADGTQVVKPFETFSDYRNLYFFAQPKCHHCFDHFGYDCDISAGDIWSPRMKANPIKHTALIARTPAGSALVAAALRDGALIGGQEPADEIANGQARTAPFHYNVTSRARVGRLSACASKTAPTPACAWWTTPSPSSPCSTSVAHAHRAGDHPARAAR